ncbi:MAG: GerMN domain-containing protein [Oscillospiraceae bacterium]
MKIRLCALVLALLLLAGCGASVGVEKTVNPINFYFCAADGGPNRRIDFERPSGALSVQTVDLGRQDISIGEILTRYLAFCRDGGYGPFPEGLECMALTLENGVLTLTFNDAFSSLSGVDLSLAAAALTMTLTQIDGVDGVSIHGRSAILSGDWQEVFTADDFLLQDGSAVHPEYAVQLYFLDAGGNLTAQRRVLTCDDRSQLPELAMDALLAGPDEPGLTCAVPAGTQLADVSVDGALCTVVLSEEFAACDTDEASAQAAVRAWCSRSAPSSRSSACSSSCSAAQGCNTAPSTHRLPRIPPGWSDHTYKNRSEVPFGAFFIDS